MHANLSIGEKKCEVQLDELENFVLENLKEAKKIKGKTREELEVTHITFLSSQPWNADEHYQTIALSVNPVNKKIVYNNYSTNEEKPYSWATKPASIARFFSNIIMELTNDGLAHKCNETDIPSDTAKTSDEEVKTVSDWEGVFKEEIKETLSHTIEDTLEVSSEIPKEDLQKEVESSKDEEASQTTDSEEYVVHSRKIDPEERKVRRKLFEFVEARYNDAREFIRGQGVKSIRTSENGMISFLFQGKKQKMTTEQLVGQCKQLQLKWRTYSHNNDLTDEERDLGSKIIMEDFVRDEDYWWTVTMVRYNSVKHYLATKENDSSIVDDSPKQIVQM